MSSWQIANRLAEMCKAGAWDQVQNELFHQDAISLDPDGMPSHEVKEIYRIRRKGETLAGMKLSDKTPDYLNRVVQGDTFDLLNRVSDNSVDLIICDGPYGVTANSWDNPREGIQQFNLNLIKRFSRKLKSGGSLYLFGKPDCIDFIDYRPYLNLKSKIVWYQPSRLAQGRVNYTNNYDVICYFVKGSRPNTFNLDDIRVPQLVELSHRLRCENVPSVRNGKYGKTKFNRKGKNPGNVWGDIKQLTYKSKELVSRQVLNTIQKPESLIERLVLASSNEGDVVLDPFCGVGTCPVVCRKNGRNYLAFEINPEFVKLSNERQLDNSRNNISHVGFSERWSRSNGMVVYEEKG